MDCFAICSSITQMETQGNKRKSGIYLKGVGVQYILDKEKKRVEG